MRTTTRLHRAPGRPRNPRPVLTTTDIEADNLRLFAELRGFSQEDIAHIAKVSYSMARQYLNGHRRIPDARLVVIARALRVNPQQIRPNFQPALEMKIPA